MQIKITLPRNRADYGRLELREDDRIVFACDCYGKAHSILASQAGNPTRDPFRHQGDAPTGSYEGTISPLEVPAQEPKRSRWLKEYGQWPVIYMNPTGGDGLTARANGRRNILICGGHLSKHGKLEPSDGRIRIEDKHQNALLYELQKRGVTKFPIEVTEA